jgi:hypothetical protein
MQRRTGLAVPLGVLGLSGAIALSFMAVTHLSASGSSCGTIMWNSEVPSACDGVLNRQSSIVIVLFFVSELLLLAAGLIFLARYPGSRFRAWVLPLCIVAIPASILLLLPAAITDAKRSDGDPTTTAQWLYVLGTLAVPLVVTILVAAFGLMDRDRRAASRRGTDQRLPTAP